MRPYFEQNGITLYHGDFREVLPSLGVQFRLIATDPPYLERFLPLYGDLARVGRDALSEGGSLLAMCGHMFLPQIYALLSEHLRYHWTLDWLAPHLPVQVWNRKVMTSWKPILWYVKGKYTGRWTGDTIWAGGLAGSKDFHVWGQSLKGFIDLVGKLANAGELVLDPMAGGGTTLKACQILGLPCVGVELEEQSCEVIAKRLTQVAPARAGQPQFEFDERGDGGLNTPPTVATASSTS